MLKSQVRHHVGRNGFYADKLFLHSYERSSQIKSFDTAIRYTLFVTLIGFLHTSTSQIYYADISGKMSDVGRTHPTPHTAFNAHNAPTQWPPHTRTHLYTPPYTRIQINTDNTHKRKEQRQKDTRMRTREKMRGAPRTENQSHTGHKKPNHQ